MNNLRDEAEMTVIKEYVTWDDIEDFISHLAEDTNNFERFNGVYGPARGGLIFATIISNRYNIPYLGAPQVGCLIVDDICDSGKTALCWKEKGYTIATMYYKRGALVKPDYWYKEKGDKWIVFPIEENNARKAKVEKLELPKYELDIIRIAIEDAYKSEKNTYKYDRANDALDSIIQVCEEYNKERG